MNILRLLCKVGLHKNEIIVDEPLTDQWKEYLGDLMRYWKTEDLNCHKLRCVRCGREYPEASVTWRM